MLNIVCFLLGGAPRPRLETGVKIIPTNCSPSLLSTLTLEDWPSPTLGDYWDCDCEVDVLIVTATNLILVFLFLKDKCQTDWRCSPEFELTLNVGIVGVVTPCAHWKNRSHYILWLTVTLLVTYRFFFIFALCKLVF